MSLTALGYKYGLCIETYRSGRLSSAAEGSQPPREDKTQGPAPRTRGVMWAAEQ